MNACMGGGPYTADDNCAISDVDQDGDVDDNDADLFVAAAEGAAGALTGNSLLVSRPSPTQLALSWNPSCSPNDVDYAVYEGTLGDFTTHTSLICSTDGATSATVTPSAGARYYLVVPLNGFREGSYGRASDGTPHPPGGNQCLPQTAGACGP
jgi:hypothetical protein